MKNLLVLRALAMGRTVENDPLMKFKFRVTIPGFPSGMGFQKASGLTAELEVAEYDEGGYDYTHKLAGRGKVGEVTLERGAYASKVLEDSYKDMLKKGAERKTIVIEQLDRFGAVQRTYKLAEAWISKWEGTDLDASSSDVAVEKITIQHEYFL